MSVFARAWIATVAVVLCGLAAASGAPAKSAGHPYVALGDSYTVGWEGDQTATPGFVGPLYSDYKASLGASQLLNLGEPGASSSSLRNNGQLATAISDINASSDTRAVTLEIGGADILAGDCPGHFDEAGTCPFRANYANIIGQLQAALAGDPGAESLITTVPPNPSEGTGTADETSFDQKLLGANLTVGCDDSGADVGLNDAIFQGAGALGVPVANPYPAFEQHGQDYMAQDDPQHLHPNDAGYAAIARAFRNPGTRCGATPDRNPPETTIKSGPIKGTTSDRTPTFKLKSSEAGSTFKCSHDGSPFKHCTALYTTPKLGYGRHTVSVRATDAAGNADPKPAGASFRVVR